MFPVKSVVKSFGKISRDSVRILTMEWLIEGVSILFIATVVTTLTVLNDQSIISIAVFILCIITLAVFAVRACRAGRSSFYTIAACAATSLLVFQTCLNVFGAVDILPFTGVTLPFVSNGGSSMLSAWGMLAFLKATDTRQNASFAVRLPSRRELRGEE